ncbi:hypothetical protein ACFSC4_27730 [Deinococcus malanensis]|uniref:hypothetical protein n=1 Tax=Deinococcus malanensis TaxID=1706855 RepID=UPI00166E51B6|nr:hypothetical protein [Deinococcus malanensis]
MISPTTHRVTAQVHDWQTGQATREELVDARTSLPSGEEVHDVLQALASPLSRPCTDQAGPSGTDDWRQELLSCNARGWHAPHAAGLLVGPSKLLLTDGERAVILDDAGTRCLPSGWRSPSCCSRRPS